MSKESVARSNNYLPSNQSNIGSSSNFSRYSPSNSDNFSSNSRLSFQNHPFLSSSVDSSNPYVGNKRNTELSGNNLSTTSMSFVPILVTPIRSRSKLVRYKNSDDFFTRIDEVRQSAIDDLINNPNDFMKSLISTKAVNLIPRDLQCKYKMGDIWNINERLSKEFTDPGIDLYQICRSCDAMDLLSKPIDMLNGVPFYPSTGQWSNNCLVLSTQSNYCDIERVVGLGDIIKDIIKEDPLASSCQPSLPILSRTIYYSLDSLTNTILTNWYISRLLSSRKINPVRHIYYGFICGDRGHILMESKKYIDLLSYEITHVYQTWGLLFQLFSILHELRDHQLSFHSINNLTFMLDPKSCEYYYNDVKVEDNVTLIINDFSDLGINVNKGDSPVRLYRGHKGIDEYYNRVAKKVIIWSRQNGLADRPGAKPESWVTYRIGPENKRYHDYGLLAYDDNRRPKDPELESFLHANRMGIPMYRGSFDAYRLILLLCSNEGFYHSLMRNHRLNALWRSFWSPLEYDIINERIRENHESKSSNQSSHPYTSMLTGLNLRCNLISHIWRQLKDYSHTEHESTHNLAVKNDDIIQSPPSN